MSYTHALECSDGLWLAYRRDGRWIGRPAYWNHHNGYVTKARYKVDILVPSHVITITAL